MFIRRGTHFDLPPLIRFHFEWNIPKHRMLTDFLPVHNEKDPNNQKMGAYKVTSIGISLRRRRGFSHNAPR
jgi:hypothetical protein